MAKFTVTIGASVQAYRTIEIEAPNEAAADNRVQEIIVALDSGGWPKELDGFEPDWSTLNDFRHLENLGTA